jgi:hypothetical protein
VRYGLLAGPLPTELPGAAIVQKAADDFDFSPLVVYAIKANETGTSVDPNVISSDGGHGWMQLTASFPPGWADPYTNVAYAIANFLAPAEAYWAAQGFLAETLLRFIAAEYNAGRGQTAAGHAAGNLDLYTTNNYAARALANYQALADGKSPFVTP